MYSYFHVLALFYSYSGFQFKTVCISNRSLPASVLLFLLPTFDLTVLCSFLLVFFFSVLKDCMVFHFCTVRQRAEFWTQAFIICTMKTASPAARHLFWVLKLFFLRLSCIACRSTLTLLGEK